MLTSQAVQEIMVTCLFKDEELENGVPRNCTEYIEVMGLTRCFRFHKERTMGKRKT